MKIIAGADHGGLELKEKLVSFLAGTDHTLDDIGTFSTESVDYPCFAVKVALAVADGKADRGLLICGSGIGMCMAANRVIGARAVNASDSYTARMSRRHNNSNILCLGGRFVGPDMAIDILVSWLGEPFDAGRHQRRIDLIDQLVRASEQAGLPE